MLLVKHSAESDDTFSRKRDAFCTLHGLSQSNDRERNDAGGALNARLVVAALLAHSALPVFAQDTQTLVRAAKNPLANLTNVQFIYDANLDTGARDKTQHVLNIQPVIPFAVSTDWSLITRTIIPLIAQAGQSAGEGWSRGSGDTQLSALLSPAHTGQLVWGIGSAFQIPSASRDALGQGRWAAGPTAGALWLGKQWTVGGLVSNVWSFGGAHGRAAINQMQLEPMITYNFEGNPNRYLSSSPTIIANWNASGRERWTVPLSLGIGQLVKFGSQSVNLQATAYYNIVRPADASSWTLELQVQFLFPK
jgi:hypothetical protein